MPKLSMIANSPIMKCILPTPLGEQRVANWYYMRSVENLLRKSCFVFFVCARSSLNLWVILKQYFNRVTIPASPRTATASFVMRINLVIWWRGWDFWECNCRYTNCVSEIMFLNLSECNDFGSSHDALTHAGHFLNFFLHLKVYVSMYPI